MRDKKKQLEQGLSGGPKDIRAYQGLEDAVFDALNDQVVNDDSLNIMEIRADITQPRRIIPREIRGSWNGMPDGVPALLDRWAHEAGVSASVVEKMLAGSQSVHSVSGVDPVLDEFAKLIDLASQIFDVGLQQRIGVSSVGDGYQIIFGERRWMAFHALAHWVSEEWHQIPAKVASVSPWELAKIQAAENFQRVELNAIEKARQFAKLLIVSRADTTDVPYDAWNTLVVEGGCDRPYYAQVADGNIHPIPYGMGSQFEQALGISTGQMRNYRSILRPTGEYEVDNWFWDVADKYDWSEKFQREIVQHIGISWIHQARDKHISDEWGIDAVGRSFREKIAQGKAIKKSRSDAEKRHPGDASPEESNSPAPSGHSFGGEYVGEVTPSLEQEHVSQLPPNPAKSPVMDSQKRYELTEKYLNKRVVLRGGKSGTVINVETMGLRVRLEDGAKPIISESAIVEILGTTPPQPYRLSRAQLEALTVRYAGYYVRLSGNRAGEVLDVKDDGRIRIKVDGQPASSLHDEAEIEAVINETAYLEFIGRITPPQPSPNSGQESDKQDDYEVPEYLDGASDKGLSSKGYVEADSLLDMQSGDVSTVLFAMYSLAQKVKADDARNVAGTLTTYSMDDVEMMAEQMTADEVEALLQGHNHAMALFFEGCMRSVEEYTRWMQEQVADCRELE